MIGGDEPYLNHHQQVVAPSFHAEKRLGTVVHASLFTIHDAPKGIGCKNLMEQANSSQNFFSPHNTWSNRSSQRTRLNFLVKSGQSVPRLKALDLSLSQTRIMEGRCQCGAVQFITPSTQPLAVYHCHCRECQLQSASAFGTTAIFERFDLPKEAPIGRWDRKTDSGNLMKCYFCRVCGTRLMHDRGLSTVSIKGGCLEGLDWSGAKHIWAKRAVVSIPEGVERWDYEPEED
jgi:hypothetical protein